ncbi:hypothetical protein [Micromonospora coriariae]|uniref:hypothetical protein n=1 Tax=Micromonospora coriariae TaxID=285665 RepID=UPI000B5ADCB1|nr:hypothetical protein [Micromonospora coriariae]
MPSGSVNRACGLDQDPLGVRDEGSVGLDPLVRGGEPVAVPLDGEVGMGPAGHSGRPQCRVSRRERRIVAVIKATVTAAGTPNNTLAWLQSMPCGGGGSNTKIGVS